MIVHLRSNKTAEDIIRANIKFMLRNPELKITNADSIPEKTNEAQNQSGN